MPSDVRWQIDRYRYIEVYRYTYKYIYIDMYYPVIVFENALQIQGIIKISIFTNLNKNDILFFLSLIVFEVVHRLYVHWTFVFPFV